MTRLMPFLGLLLLLGKLHRTLLLVQTPDWLVWLLLPCLGALLWLWIDACLRRLVE
jgi:hypothetical protein